MPVSSKAAPLLAVLGRDGQFVDEAIDYPVGLRAPRQILALRARLRATGARRLVYLMPERPRRAVWRDYLFFRLCGFRDILAFPASADLRQCRTLPDGWLEPEAARLARNCVLSIGPVDLDDPSAWNLQLTPIETARGVESRAPLGGAEFIAINMGGKVHRNDWGHENWRQLIERLAAHRPNFGLMVVGAPSDSARAAALLDPWPGPKLDLCGQLQPRESAAAMKGAACFIGHDSGPLHLAANVGVPVLGLFGDNNPPGKWHPFGPVVSVLHRMAGVGAITVDEVEAAALHLLRGGAGQVDCVMT
ncbi:glycosyltransferase family 9 protein [Xinfangfangia sp. CPCC 101601]|uniref:Glycosyltransferase family 9 protein n=1 Tax=Pseudogemmobacter lacusdianii TaxID=3069608 RepID=A0ABU0VV87_9RHOB|nr:glycosyltransferase family 9 protein [Xinfangfangia sp. CPCC 101601]MDQ2065657.1 glycosyltransferase family 9 protein [Xinfangfangia sp. CPCC 101601]